MNIDPRDVTALTPIVEELQKLPLRVVGAGSDEWHRGYCDAVKHALVLIEQLDKDFVLVLSKYFK